jgi:hypothetical protein
MAKKQSKEIELKCNAQVSIITKSSGKKAEAEFLNAIHLLDEFCMNNGIDLWVDFAYIDNQEI